MIFSKFKIPLLISTILFGSFAQEAHANTIEDNLPDCLELTTELIELQKRLGDGKILSERPEAIISMLLAGNYFSSKIRYFSPGDTPEPEIFEELKSATIVADQIEKATVNLLKEAKSQQVSYKYRAEFIAKCINKFDGKAESQRQIIENLQTQIFDLKKQLSQTQKELRDSRRKIDSLEQNSVEKLSSSQRETILTEEKLSKLEMAVGKLIGKIQITSDAENLLNFIANSEQNIRNEVLKTWIEQTHSSATTLQKSCMNWLLKHGEVTSACNITLRQLISQ